MPSSAKLLIKPKDEIDYGDCLDVWVASVHARESFTVVDFSYFSVVDLQRPIVQFVVCLRRVKPF